MKLTSDDPRLTSYVLGELSPEESAAVERAIAKNPSLQAEAKGLEDLCSFLNEGLSQKPLVLRSGQREKIRQAAASGKVIVPSRARKLAKIWLPPLAAAAAFALITTFVVQNGQLSKDNSHTTHTPTKEPVSDIPPTPNVKLSSPTAPSSASSLAVAAKSKSPHERPLGYLSSAEFPTLDLPAQSVKTDIAWVRRSISDKQLLPPRGSVKTEELLSSLSLRPMGTTLASPETTVFTESIRCPWKPSARLCFVSFQRKSFNSCEIKATYHANPEDVRAYRLLSSMVTLGEENSSLTTRLAANSSMLIAFEIEPSENSHNLGEIEWTINGQPAAPIAMNFKTNATPSSDARFAALVCAYAQWLNGEQVDAIDKEMVLAMKQEVATEVLSTDRLEFTILVEKSLELCKTE